MTGVLICIFTLFGGGSRPRTLPKIAHTFIPVIAASPWWDERGNRYLVGGDGLLRQWRKNGIVVKQRRSIRAYYPISKYLAVVGRVGPGDTSFIFTVQVVRRHNGRVLQQFRRAQLLPQKRLHEVFICTKDAVVRISGGRRPHVLRRSLAPETYVEDVSEDLRELITTENEGMVYWTADGKHHSIANVRIARFSSARTILALSDRGEMTRYENSFSRAVHLGKFADVNDLLPIPDGSGRFLLGDQDVRLVSKSGKLIGVAEPYGTNVMGWIATKDRAFITERGGAAYVVSLK